MDRHNHSHSHTDSSSSDSIERWSLPDLIFMIWQCGMCHIIIIRIMWFVIGWWTIIVDHRRLPWLLPAIIIINPPNNANTTITVSHHTDTTNTHHLGVGGKQQHRIDGHPFCALPHYDRHNYCYRTKRSVVTKWFVLSLPYFTSKN